MKMVEKDVLLTFPSESLTNNCAEDVSKQPNKDLTLMQDDITTNNCDNQTDEPQPSSEPTLTDSYTMDLLTQEDAVDEFLVAESKNDFNDDLLLPENDEEAIDFKHENDLMPCEEDLAKTELMIESRIDEAEGAKSRHQCRKHVKNLVRALAKRTKRRLNKMHVMENVQEACEIQPSSPGHAGQATETTEAKLQENGVKQERKPSTDEITTTNSGLEPKIEPKVVENGSPNCEDLIEKETEAENGISNLNEDTFSNDSTSTDNKNLKRKFEGEDSTTVKKIKSDIQENFLLRDKILNEYIELGDCSSLEQMHTYTEQVIAEIKTLNDLAREKEREWNNIIHLKKLKEELLLRLQRRKQLLYLSSDKNELSDPDTSEPDEKLKSNNQSILKTNLANPRNTSLKIPTVNSEKNCLGKLNMAQRHLLNSNDLNSQYNEYKQARQRNVLDVQSIIADYRQRHPETVPRRGRRIRSMNNQTEKVNSTNVLNFASVALGSGSQVRHNVPSGSSEVSRELDLLLNALDGNKAGETSNETSFREMLVQIAKMSQTERHELINAVKPPPPYPEVTVHPVVSPVQTQSNSLLHGILTKAPAKSTSKTSFSPTLARLLTAPERSVANAQLNAHPTDNVSITDILSTSKARNEITITPVGQFESVTKEKAVNQTEEEEAEDSADRLVIDETCEPIDARNRADNGSEAGDEVPQCQGCNQRAAQFVCAGCGNQWYCSRDCQVTAWDEHSEVCSG